MGEIAARGFIENGARIGVGLDRPLGEDEPRAVEKLEEAKTE